MVGKPAVGGWIVRVKKRRFGLMVGEALAGVGRLVRPLVPQRMAKAIDDRFFGAVFQVTRVTNDNYGTGTKEKPGNLDEKR